MHYELISLAAISAMAAIYAQLLCSGRFLGVVRLVLGIEILSLFLSISEKGIQFLY